MTRAFRVYIACSLRERERAKAFRQQLLRRGVSVTSRWIDAEEDTQHGMAPADMHKIARMNQDDMDAADACVALLSPHVRGALVELGYMCGRGKPTFAVGAIHQPTLMADLCGVIEVSTEEYAAELLARCNRGP